MLKKSPFTGVLAATAVCALAPLAPAAAATEGATEATEAQKSAAADAQKADVDRAKAEAQLQAARQKLEEAAREVAELSARGMGDYGFGHSRAIIGALLDLATGDQGLKVISVSPGGPAAEAGVKAGDVIVSINGTDVKGGDAARTGLRALREVKPDSKVALKVLRDGKTQEIAVTARAAPRIFMGEQLRGMGPLPPFLSLPPGEFLPPQPPAGIEDLELATLTPQLGHYFGTEKGVLVVRAPEGGAMALKDGDVILQVDNRDAGSASHLSRIFSTYQAGEKLTLHILRDHKALTLQSVLPEGPRGRRDGFFFQPGREGHGRGLGLGPDGPGGPGGPERGPRGPRGPGAAGPDARHDGPPVPEAL